MFVVTVAAWLRAQIAMADNNTRVSWNMTTNGSTSSQNHDDVGLSTVFFLFLVFTIGAAVRHLLKRTSLPYTVVLIVVGLCVGAAPRWSRLSFLNKYLYIAQLDPHLMLFIFLPTLIFESAFVLDVHIFKKMIWQASLLAGPGLLVSSALTAIIARFILSYGWSWVVAFLFGVIMSATDPVTIVSLLRELGISKQLGTIIEGESLLNDGAAIVIFNVLINELIPGQGRDGLQIFLYFLRVAFGGPLFGYLAAKISIFWLSRVYNDALIETAITLASTYITYYIGEELLGVSGVLAVVALGYEINSRKTNISPEVEVFLHKFWKVLGYFANTMIFVLVGVVISQRAFQGVDSNDWMFLAVLYFGIIVIRMTVTAGFFPILTRIGYAIDMRQVLVISWGGLKGAVSLALALGVAQTSAIDFNTIGSKVLFHTAGIVILTLFINATTTKYLLKVLGMRDISIARCRTMSSAVAKVNETKQRAMTQLKSDRFLADANWDVVYKSSTIPNPYEQIELSKNLVVPSSYDNRCPQCAVQVPRLLNQEDLTELAEEIRRKIIKREKTSYWHQFEQGMLSQEAVHVLINLADTVLDTPERLITLKDIALHWKIPKVFSMMRQLLHFMIGKPNSERYPRPSKRILLPFYKIATSQIKEWIIYTCIVINFVISTAENFIFDGDSRYYITDINFIFCAIYFVDFVIHIIGLRKNYWLVKLNYIDIFLIIFNIFDVILTSIFFSLRMNTALTVIRSFRTVRFARLIRSNNPMLPLLVKFVDYFANRHLRFGYDIGRGFVVGEEDVLLQFDRFKQIDADVAEKLRQKVEETRLNTIRSLGLIRKEHPGIALSVKTQHATRAILNNCKDTVRLQLSNGLLDEADADKLMRIIDRKIKRLENTSASLPAPNSDVLFSQLLVLDGLHPGMVNYLRTSAVIQQFVTGDYLQDEDVCIDGLFIIISGLVKVFSQVPGTTLETSATSVTVTDYLGPGNVIGNLSNLQERDSCSKAYCETDVQGFFIPLEILWEAMAQFPVLEEKLWRIYGVRNAYLLLERLPEYQEWSNTRLLLMCENSYAVCSSSSSRTAIFEITEEMREVIVIDGKVHCIVSGAVYKSPSLIPKRIQQISLTDPNAKLLVILNKEIPIESFNHVHDTEESNYPPPVVKTIQYIQNKINKIENSWLWSKLPFRDNRIIPDDEETPPQLCDSCLAKQNASANIFAYNIIPPTKSNVLAKQTHRAVSSSNNLAEGDVYAKKRLRRTSSTGDIPKDIHKTINIQATGSGSDLTSLMFKARMPSKLPPLTINNTETAKDIIQPQLPPLSTSTQPSSSVPQLPPITSHPLPSTSIDVLPPITPSIPHELPPITPSIPQSAEVMTHQLPPLMRPRQLMITGPPPANDTPITTQQSVKLSDTNLNKTASNNKIATKVLDMKSVKDLAAKATIEAKALVQHHESKHEPQISKHEELAHTKHEEALDHSEVPIHHTKHEEKSHHSKHDEKPHHSKHHKSTGHHIVKHHKTKDKTKTHHPSEPEPEPPTPKEKVFDTEAAMLRELLSKNKGGEDDTGPSQQHPVEELKEIDLEEEPKGATSVATSSSVVEKEEHSKDHHSSKGKKGVKKTKKYTSKK